VDEIMAGETNGYRVFAMGISPSAALAAALLLSTRNSMNPGGSDGPRLLGAYPETDC
jgi:hypothetical protein